MRRHAARWAQALLLVCGVSGFWGLSGQLSNSHAASAQFCTPEPTLTATQQDRLFRFASIIKIALEQSGQRMALVARSGTDLERFGVRYSHAGLSLLASPNTPWSVRQLYYACDEQQPRIFDQGMSGFVLGGKDPDLGYVSVVLLPPAEAALLEHAALDNQQALQLLGASYSANAYPFSPRYQNCNQWVAELLAAAWGGPVIAHAAGPPRVEAQRWLVEKGYTPTVFEAGNPLMMSISQLVPLLHSDDHPPEDIASYRYRVSMPAAIEALVRRTAPGATRIEFCHTSRHVVLRHGWQAIAEGCQPDENDTVIPL